MKGPPLPPGGKDITWPNQVAPSGRKPSSTRNLKPQNLKTVFGVCRCVQGLRMGSMRKWSELSSQKLRVLNQNHGS